MDTRKIEKYVNTFGLPVLTVVAGILLLVNPDGAAALITKLAGWTLVICGAAKLIKPAISKQPIRGTDWVANGIVIVIGVFLLSRPMVLADGLGRFFGILLLLEGFDSFRKTGVSLLTILTFVAGAVLIVMPRTLTQTLIGAGGIVMIVIGVVNTLGRLNKGRLKEPGDPNIIDADP